ncbi:MAG: hypothetical protein Q8O22_05490 [Candidatus Omnitrophota bacterium]|nr:hypothetical protein [Candidatus Omnitrophota bacterium]
MFIRLNKRAQSTLEYAVIIAVVVAGLVAMQVYIKRGMQGRLRQASDDIGEQFSPGHTTGNIVTNSTVSSNEEVTAGVNGSTTTESEQSQNRMSNETVANFVSEDWVQ